MKKKYSVIMMADEYSCAVKQVSKNTYDQMQDMLARGENDAKILKSLTELNTSENNILINGITKNDAVDYALSNGDDYVILKAFGK